MTLWLAAGAATESVELWLNALTYDSLPHAAAGVGFKVYVHDSDETPVTTDHYFYVSPGNHYDVTIAKGTQFFLHPDFQISINCSAE